ncbi:hypothetical protein HGRIS_000933 [Hohenbuehelia grisea]|uniref:Uncharacterized protein n=1 Tax=Hohenbuehelia grisea TaxID=104357 RepID=A0ABR3IQ76_9AGAR
MVGCALAITVFGALHLAAWDFDFPSHVEQLLWRIASCILTGTALLGLIFIFDKFNTRICVCGVHDLPLAEICSMIYIIARLFLAVEVFVLLRHLPPQALQDVNWLKYIPHV